ncbi:MAG: hypothetical protein A2664_04595 [Candidatus Taylorbacteria bacterium RIFCSPHIGHO2_01_FULL_46_22b]|uniref:Alpha/beta hydrolase n=1 Tax=Candidatus Taylorbacteria bacterium RIFCSPHIGHO2_01_FULL_46_22b TaxID=1802301 RepID=A0A1G2M4F8_9BACT|nr:MAG: hypothetical protein A2664_04595 [Candidatus Taylorbacteria bacterium RIFCSPHIGHO2_01_FULL_46_22b]
MKRVFLIHGWEGTPQNHWFPWLTHALVDHDFTVFVPTMPNTMHPKFSEWLAELARVVGVPDKDTYFVGHSLGCITIVRYIEQISPNVKIGGCVFVAGFSNDLDLPEISEFVSTPVDFGKVKSHLGTAVTIYSDNDEYISVAESKDFSKKLGAKEIFEKGQGHFCMSDGVTELPSALNAILEFSNR